MAKSRKKVETVEQIIDQIKQRLDSIEDLMTWVIPAARRFRKGQRVKFSQKAHEQHICKRDPPRGSVVGLDSFWVKVLLDGRKHPQTMHHSFFDPITRSR